jgi:probable F420-dependent oxidoreductase
VKFGLHLPNSGALAAHADFLTMGRRAEEIGFDTLWVFDHLFNPVTLSPESVFPGGPYYNKADMPYFESITTLSALAGATSTINLGTRVLIAAYRNPLMLAKQIGTLCAIAGERVILGIGTGWMHEEFNALAIDPHDRFHRLDEHIALMRQAWTKGISAFSGEYYAHVEGGFYPVPHNPIPIIIGGSSPGALRRVARLGDGWAMTGFRPGPDMESQLNALLDQLRRECDAAGRDFDALRLVAGCSINADKHTFEVLANAGTDDVDIALGSAEQLDLVQAEAFLGEMKASFG